MSFYIFRINLLNTVHREPEVRFVDIVSLELNVTGSVLCKKGERFKYSHPTRSSPVGSGTQERWHGGSGSSTNYN